MSNFYDNQIPKPVDEEDIKIDLYYIGLEELNLTDKDIKKIAEFFFYMYSCLNQKRKEKNIAKDALSMLKGAVSAFGTKKFNNIEWREHCASSIREIFHGFSNNGDWTHDFQKTFFENKEIPEKLKPLIEFTRFYYGYFSGIDHHEPNKILGNFQSILLCKGEIVERGSVKLEDHTNDDFTKIVQDFFSTVKQIISFLISEGKYSIKN